jgi:ABC-2 type transport system permease protein
MSVRTTRLVIEREIKESARRRSMWAIVGVVFLGSAAIAVLPEVLPERDGGGTVVIVGDDDIGVTEAFDAMTNPAIETESAADRNEAATSIELGDADVGLLLDDSPPIVLTEEKGSLSTLVREVVASRLAVSALTDAGLDETTIGEAFAAAQPAVELVDEELGGRQFSAFIVSIVLYMLTVILTSQVASAVAVEKSNRVSEVLLAIVPPRSMLFGKVIGVGCIGVATLAVAATPPSIRYLVGADLPEGFGGTIVASSAWFVLGLALYLTLAGALGSLVARQEEVGAVVAPLTMLLVAGYLIAISSSDSVVGQIFAFFPLTSPMVEPYRIAVGDSSAAEMVVSLTILALSVWAMSLVGTTIFRRAIVRTGTRLKLRDVVG